MTRMIGGVKLIARVSTDVLWDRVGVAAKIKNILQSRLRWYGHVIHRDISSLIHEVMELEIAGKKKKA